MAEVAVLAGSPYEVLRKTRTGDRAVEISVPDNPALRHGTPVVLDDIASSVRTQVRTLQRRSEAGTGPAVCVVTQAVFAETAYADILAAGASRIVTTDDIPYVSNVIGNVPLMAEAVRDAVTELTFQSLETLHSDQNSIRKGRKNE